MDRIVPSRYSRYSIQPKQKMHIYIWVLMNRIFTRPMWMSKLRFYSVWYACCVYKWVRVLSSGRSCTANVIFFQSCGGRWNGEHESNCAYVNWSALSLELEPCPLFKSFGIHLGSPPRHLLLCRSFTASPACDHGVKMILSQVEVERWRGSPSYPRFILHHTK